MRSLIHFLLTHQGLENGDVVLNGVDDGVGAGGGNKRKHTEHWDLTQEFVPHKKFCQVKVISYLSKAELSNNFSFIR